jgi:hypothetical protein
MTILAKMGGGRKELLDTTTRTLAPNKTHLWLRYRKNKDGKIDLGEEESISKPKQNPPKQDKEAMRELAKAHMLADWNTK